MRELGNWREVLRVSKMGRGVVAGPSVLESCKSDYSILKDMQVMGEYVLFMGCRRIGDGYVKVAI